MTISVPPSYLDLLSPWPTAVKPHLYRFPHQSNMACYGPGNHGHWALQANTTAASAFAVLAAHPGLDETKTSMSRGEILDHALAMIRFTTATHHSGKLGTTDGQKWGHSWISALCLERMMHGIEALGNLIPEDLTAQLNQVLVSEAEWLLENYPVTAGLVENNKPESNIWNGCLLHRAANTVPDTPHLDQFREKGTAFLLNGISTPDDAAIEDLIAGKALSKWHVGANMYNSMGCNHHGYQNVGYMMVCLSNIAMMHFSCKANGWTPPPGLYHHAEDLWKMVKACTFDDGRLFRIGGDTRVRYCYCQDYAIPAWLWARDYLGDKDTLNYENAWRAQVSTEVTANADGSFLSTRLAGLKKVSPLYYLRLEGDRACTLGMGAYWNQKYQLDQDPAPTEKPVTLSSWQDDYHGSLLARSKTRMASWTWRAAEPPQGLMVPSNQSTMAEWQSNLSGRVLGVGRTHHHVCEWQQAECFEGGFATCGTVTVRTQSGVAEGELETDIARIDLACVALPDDRTMVVLQRAKAINRPYFREIKGLMLQVGNDLFNGSQRELKSSEGGQILVSCPGQIAHIPIDGNWLCLDDALSVIRVYGNPLSVYRPADRQINITPKNGRYHVRDAGGNYYADEICCGCDDRMHARDPDADLFDCGVVVLCGVSAKETATYAPTPLHFDHPDLRGGCVVDAHGKTLRIIANFSDKPVGEAGQSYPAKTVGFY